ncbi:MAG: HAD family hydrolase [Oceanipulchritudo sp.]
MEGLPLSGFQKMLRAAIFDWDGVVVDSSAAHKESWERLAAERDLPLPENHFERSFGKKNQLIIPEIYGWSEDLDEIEQLGNRKEALYREILVSTGLEPLPGALRLFAELKAAGIPMAVGTSTPHLNIETVLPMIGASGFFGAVIAAEDVARGKPDPEVFLKAASALGADPADCVVFEDTLHGIEAALAGGMKAVALTTSHPESHFASSPPHAVVPDLSEVCLPFLRQLWG